MKVLSKVPIEFGENFISLNPKNNQAFISNNRENTIHQIDFSSKTKSKLIELERPRDILFEPNSNRVYAIYGNAGFFLRDTGKKLCVIDVNTKQIIKDIGNKEGFAGISRNSITKKIFVTQPNKKKVWILDEKSLEIEGMVDVKGKYKQIIVNENNNDLILGAIIGSRDKYVIARYSFDSKKVENIFSQRYGGPFAEEFSIKFFPKLNKIFVYLATSTDDIGNVDSRIHVVDYDNPKTEPRITSKHRIWGDFDLDPSNEFIYFTQTKGESWTKNYYQIIKKNLSTNSEESFDIDFSYYTPDPFPSIFRIHPFTGNILIPGKKDKERGIFEISLV